MASQIDITKDIQPLTTFRNNSVKMMQRLKKTKRPIILTVNGKAEAVVQDAAAYQRLLDLVAPMGWGGVTTAPPQLVVRHRDGRFLHA